MQILTQDSLPEQLIGLKVCHHLEHFGWDQSFSGIAACNKLLVAPYTSKLHHLSPNTVCCFHGGFHLVLSKTTSTTNDDQYNLTSELTANVAADPAQSAVGVCCEQSLQQTLTC